jgi:hypothetical protein
MTMFTAIFIIVLLTMMLMYAAKVGVFEQQISSNDLRQKLAFHAAEAGLDYSFEYLRGKQKDGLLISMAAGTDPASECDGAGWFAEGCERWVSACPGALCDEDGIPTGSYIYQNLAPEKISWDSCVDPVSADGEGISPMCMNDDFQGTMTEGTRFRSTAGVCVYDPAAGAAYEDLVCLAPNAGVGGFSEGVRHVTWVASWGYSDCPADGDLAACRGKAHVIRVLGDGQLTRGANMVPFVSKNSLPASGTVEVVPHYDAGGEGVPISIWGNRNMDECPARDDKGVAEDPLVAEGSFRTCEMHEWYEVDVRPADAKCSVSSCSCDYPGPEAISYRHAGDTHFDLDVLLDEDFPCDLFQQFFGFPRSEYETIKQGAKIINDCGNSVLNEDSRGFYWFEGDTCGIDGDKSSKQVGSIDHPILLVSAATNRTTLGANTHFYGILFLTDVESDTDTYFKPGGGATVYGAVITEVLPDESGVGGTFRVVYNDETLGQVNAMGTISGSYWRDFDLPQIPSDNLSWAR